MKHITLNKPSSHRRRKRNIFKRMFASVAVTGAVVGGYILLGSNPVTADIIQLDVYSTSIYYELNTTDEDNVLTNDSLILQIQSDFDEIIIPLAIGFQAGTISNLQPNTLYTLKIIVSENDGNKILLTRTFTTLELAHLNFISKETIYG